MELTTKTDRHESRNPISQVNDIRKAYCGGTASLGRPGLEVEINQAKLGESSSPVRVKSVRNSPDLQHGSGRGPCDCRMNDLLLETSDSMSPPSENDPPRS